MRNSRSGIIKAEIAPSNGTISLLLPHMVDELIIVYK